MSLSTEQDYDGIQERLATLRYETKEIMDELMNILIRAGGALSMNDIFGLTGPEMISIVKAIDTEEKRKMALMRGGL